MTIRLATPADVPQVNALAATSVAALHGAHYSPAEIAAAIRLAYGVDWQLIQDGTYYVLHRDGVLAGAAGWSFREKIGGSHGPDEPASPTLDPRTDAARIRAFYVDPAFARRGVGSALLETCEGAARAAGFAHAELTSTLQAVPFYLSHGYVVVRPERLLFAEGFALRTQVMAKALGGAASRLPSATS